VVELTPEPRGLNLTTYASTVTSAASGNVNLIPGAESLGLSMFTATVTAATNIEVTPSTGAVALTGYPPGVVSGTPKATVTAGKWSSEVAFAQGDEWIVVFDGPAANAPAARVEITFRHI